LNGSRYELRGWTHDDHFMQMMIEENMKKGENLCTDGQPHRYDHDGECTGEDCYKTKGEKEKGGCCISGCLSDGYRDGYCKVHHQ
jgi:hypothetical protein